MQFCCLLVILDASCLFYVAWPHVSSGSDGIYLSSLSEVSPATSDCLESFFLFFFPIIACVLTFLGPFISRLFLIKSTFFGGS